MARVVNEAIITVEIWLSAHWMTLCWGLRALTFTCPWTSSQGRSNESLWPDRKEHFAFDSLLNLPDSSFCYFAFFFSLLLLRVIIQQNPAHTRKQKNWSSKKKTFNLIKRLLTWRLLERFLLASAPPAQECFARAATRTERDFAWLHEWGF